ncbi:hypothetical protein [Cytophaga aurantiaca]|uniref:hypothetical protein n=1 Tax=Cytophaga aurantiaca TaxID=29530 RepID=UPI00047620FB|nr:hypothetical protein [Cytophaga aurantiaca]
MKHIKFNVVLFILLLLFFWILIFVALIAAAAEDEGTIGTNPVWIIFAKLFYILRFPTHTLLWEFITNGRMYLFLSGLVFNGLFYAFITERITSFILLKKREE